ncbi:MAG: restriction endonuclease subunit S [bacterium]
MSWEECILSNLIDLKYGKSLPERDREAGEVPVYGSSGVTGYHNKPLIEGPGIIVGRKGTIGSVHYENRDFFPIDTVYYVKGDESKIGLKFTYYLLKTLPLNKLNTDAAVPGLNRNNALRVKCKVPSLKKQDKIVSTLSAYDDLIENNRRRIQLLEESARLLYREWFVHFRFPGHEYVELVDGLPQGWEEVKFEDTSLKFIDGDRGKNYPNHSEFCHNGYCLFLSAKNVTSGDKFNFSNELMFITKEKDSILRSGKLKRGDLVLTTRGTVGNIAYYDDSINFENIRINSGMVILRDFEDDFESYYLYVTLRSLSFKDQIKNFTSGTAQPQLPIRDLKKMKILKPSSKIMKNYCAVLKSSSLQIQNLELQNQKLKKARDILLPRLMNGEIAV